MNETVTEGLKFTPESFAADIAAIQASQTPAPVAEAQTAPVVQAVPVTATTTPPAQPETVTQDTAAITKPVEATKQEVPEKFKTQDGSLDTERLAKSTQNVDEALANYLVKEKELKRKMNEVRALENPYITPPAVIAPVPTIPVNANFAAQLEADIAKDGAGVVLAKLFTAAQESVEERVQKEISSLKSVNAENTTKSQIEAIGKSDPWVYTPEGMNTLTQILDSQPYLWQAPDPYKAAYMQYNGLKNVASRSESQVLTPTPTARPSAPVPTGQAAVHTSAPVVRLDTREQIDEHLKTLTPTQQSEFYQKMGLPAF